MREMLACVLLAGLLPAQQLVPDPSFQDSTKWTAIGPAHYVTWNPCRLNLRANNDQELGQRGLSVLVTIQTEGYYQLTGSSQCARGDGLGGLNWRVGTGHSGPICYTANRLHVHVDQDVGWLGRGTHEVRVWTTAKLNQDVTVDLLAARLTPVLLPCPSWTYEVGPTGRRVMTIRTHDIESWWFLIMTSWMPLGGSSSGGLKIPGIVGDLLLDPWRQGGISWWEHDGLGSVAIELPASITDWPWLYAQVLGIDAKGRAFLGSRGFAKP